MAYTLQQLTTEVDRFRNELESVSDRRATNWGQKLRYHVNRSVGLLQQLMVAANQVGIVRIGWNKYCYNLDFFLGGGCRWLKGYLEGLE